MFSNGVTWTCAVEFLGLPQYEGGTPFRSNHPNAGLSFHVQKTIVTAIYLRAAPTPGFRDDLLPRPWDPKAEVFPTDPPVMEAIRRWVAPATVLARLDHREDDLESLMVNMTTAPADEEDADPDEDAPAIGQIKRLASCVGAAPSTSPSWARPWPPSSGNMSPGIT